MENKKIGIIGSGIVGQTLANGFIKHGHSVMVGTRDAKKLNNWKKQTGDKAFVGSFEKTATFGDIIIHAAKGTVAIEALKLAGEQHLNGKTIIDATNPIANSAPINGVLKFFTNLDNSLMEQLQETFPKANFVKAFNTVGSALMLNPNFSGIKPGMFICGNNEDAKKEVHQILELFGWEIEDMGGVEAARAIELLCMLWCIPGLRDNSWSDAFKLLKK